MNMGARALELTHSYTLSSDGSATLHVAQLPPNPALFVPGPAVLCAALPRPFLRRLALTPGRPYSFVVVNGVPSIGHDLIVGNGQLGTQPTSPAVALPASSRRQVANAVGEVPPGARGCRRKQEAGDWVVALLGGVALGALVWL